MGFMVEKRLTFTNEATKFEPLNSKINQVSKILITGASGLVGTRLTEMLLRKGHAVSHLGRGKKAGTIPSFSWDVEKGIMDEEAFIGVDTVIHLAGAGVADKRWNEKRKQEILTSRTQSTALLARYLQRYPTIKTVVAASAIGYYGFGMTNKEYTEGHVPGKDYLATVVQAWEGEVDKIQNKRVVKLRIGIVLSAKGGALVEMAKPIRLGVGSPLGSGKQYMSWIHIDDLCRMFIQAVEDDSLQGAYNATGPYAVTNRELTCAIANVLHRPLWLPAVPACVLNIVVGEMAVIVLNGSNVSSKKIQQSGFTFQFPTLEGALQDLLS
jgi:uncharacterized protein (TIGR01777 family)